MLLLLLLQFRSEISGLRSGGDKGPMCPSKDESMPAKEQKEKNALINMKDFKGLKILNCSACDVKKKIFFF